MKYILISFQVLLFAGYAKATQVPPHVQGTICFTEATWCWAPVPGLPGKECGCPTPGGYMSGTIEGAADLNKAELKPYKESQCKTTLLKHYGYKPIGSDTYARIEKDSSVTLLKQNGKATSVQSNGGCNSDKSNIDTLLSKRIQDLNLAYKASLTVDSNYRFRDKQDSIKKTLEVCQMEEGDRAWYKEAMAETKTSKPSVQKPEPAIR